MKTGVLLEHYPGHRLEDRSVAIPEIPAWVWWMMIGLLVLPAAVFAGVWAWRIGFDPGWGWLVWTLGLMLLHEGVHAVAWKLASGLPWGAFTFGIQWKMLAPYCHSAAPMPARAYRIGAAMPLFVTGLLPWAVGLALGDWDLALAASLLISGAGGDLYTLWSIRDLPDDVLVQDHQVRAGCVVLWPAQRE